MKFALAFVLSIACNAFALDVPAPTLEFPGAQLSAQTVWMTAPSVGQESRLRIEWRDRAQTVVEPGGKFKVVLFMPDMGHGSAPTRLQRVLDGAGKQIPGVFDVTNMHFTMRGLWEVRVTLTTPAGMETKTFEITL